MIGTTISHYSALWNPARGRNPRKRDKILERLGGGGMGVVYEAQGTEFDRFVALKFLLLHLVASDQDKSRSIQEVKSARWCRKE